MLNPTASPASRPLLALLVGLVVLFSGCAGKPKDAAPQSIVGPTVSAEKGAIDGVVLTAEALPLEGADVLIRGPADETSTRTDAAGRFVASQLAPGEYLVLSSKLGFSTGQKRVDVKAGEISAATLSLAEIALSGESYQVALSPIRGRFYCGWGLSLAAGPCMPVSSDLTDSTWQNATGGDRNIFEYRTLIDANKHAPSDALATVVVEINWQPSSTSSRWLWASIEDLPVNPNGRNMSEPVWAQAKGSGPLKVAATPGVKNTGGTVVMPLNAPGLLVGVYPSVDPNSPEVSSNVNAGASAYMDQSFEVWITLFYNEPAPADYTAIQG